MYREWNCFNGRSKDTCTTRSNRVSWESRPSSPLPVLSSRDGRSTSVCLPALAGRTVQSRRLTMPSVTLSYGRCRRIYGFSRQFSLPVTHHDRRCSHVECGKCLNQHYDRTDFTKGERRRIVMKTINWQL